MTKPKVFFSKDLSSEGLIKIYKALNPTLAAPVAVKLHSGEEGNQNYLQPEFWKDLIYLIEQEYKDYKVVECNTAYDGMRDTTEKHLKLIDKHGWSKYFNFDLMDATGLDDVLMIENGKRIHKNYVGKNLKNYNSMIVLSHFKGHPMGGFGGAIKQLSIGVASSHGKAYIHGAGDVTKIWTQEHDWFLESMADAAGSIVKKFEGKIAFINVMKNMSVDCDCCSVAEDPCMQDIGILASLDPVAIDKACIDLVYNSNDPGKNRLIERIETRNGIHTIYEAYECGYGNIEYELEEIK